MRVLSVNVGSTSFKYKLYLMQEQETELASGHFEGVARAQGGSRQRAGALEQAADTPAAGCAEAIADMLKFLTAAGALDALPDCVAFKTVAASGMTGVQRVDEEVLARMARFNALLPAHNPPYIAAIRQFRRAMPATPLVACFETGFFADMPAHAAAYALPRAYAEQGLKRSGAHGASHEYVAGWARARMGRDARLISCHLGGSSSVAAIRDGRGADTTIGLSMQTGLPHNNRAGDLDAYLTFYLHDALGMPLDEIRQLYETRGELLGLSDGLSGDMRTLTARAQAGDPRAAFAVDAYCYQLKKYVGAFAAALGGVDAVAFTGGIGEHSAPVRGKALQGLAYMGIALDPEKNARALAGDDISARSAPVRVFVVAANEELVIARKARRLLEGEPTRSARGG